jgi:cell division protease FtsH
MSLPLEDRLTHSRAWVLDRIAMALGGRIAEEVKFGQLTTGATDDFRQATKLARSMVTEWGMSDKLGPMAWGERDESAMFQFGPAAKSRDYSEETAREIDNEVRRVISEQYTRARALIEENRAHLDAIAEALLERETLDQEELTALMKGEPLPDRERIIIPTYAEKQKRAREEKDRKGSIFQPRPREVPQGS